MLQVALFCFAIAVKCSQALECGIDIKGSEEQLREITNLCLSGNKAVVYGTTLSEDDYNSTTEQSIAEPQKNHPRRKSRAVEDEDSDEHDGSTTQINNTTLEISTGIAVNQTSNNTKNCIVQCVLQRIGMTDTNGYPEHHRVLEGLLKTAEGRELRDFLQDSTDECFKLMQQADTLDSCTYSGMLVTCLAEKGRSNCGDWPVGKLPFH